MTLTKTQRDFLIKQLGATPRKKKLLQVRTNEEKKTDKYLELEKKALKSVAELEGLIGASELVSKLEKEVAAIQQKVGKITESTQDAVLKNAQASLEEVEGRIKVQLEPARKYAAAEKAAKAELAKVEADLMKVDKNSIQNELINAAAEKAKKGDFAEAMTLLGKVKDECAAAKAVTKKGAVADWWGEEFRKLKEHPQRDSFKTEIERLQKTLDSAKKCHMEGVGTLAHTTFSNLHWAAIKEIEFADKHGEYLNERDTVVKPLVKDLAEGEPKTSMPAIAEEKSTIEGLLTKADKRAAQRQYELATKLLEEVKLECAAAKKTKEAHGTNSTETAAVEKLVAALGVGPGKLSKEEAAAIRTKLTKAKSVAGKKDFAGSNELLAQTRLACETAAKIAVASENDMKEKDEALAGVGKGASAESLKSSLEKVKVLFANLKKREGKEGIATEIAEIGKVIKTAETALK
jgi:hypothetical protein